MSEGRPDSWSSFLHDRGLKVVDSNEASSRPTGTEKSLEYLDGGLLWQVHNAAIVKAKQFQGPQFFYPVYRWQNFYSFSPFHLILKKGYLSINTHAESFLDRTRGDTLPPSLFIDKDIERLGGPPELTRTIRKPDEFSGRLAEAMQQDAWEIEGYNQGKSNVILCGGKDSLNLLLLRWRNPTRVYSAAPNFELVKQFVVDNRLDLEVLELKDRHDEALQAREIAEACCMVDLSNWRWASHLRDIARDLDGKAVFWKGQFADAVLTDYWRSYTSTVSKSWKTYKKIYRRVARILPGPVTALPDSLVLEEFRRSIWERGAVMQGAHMGFLRSITDCLFVSGYHGAGATQVWLAGDFPALTRSDLRLAVGRVLLGKEVVYPLENPAPPLATFRQGLRSVENLITAYTSFGVAVRRDPS